MKSRMDAAHQIVWQNGVLLGQDGLPMALPPGEAPDIALAHQAVDAWAEAAGLPEQLPHAGAWTPWWYLRFLLVHDILFRMLPQFRALRPHLEATAPGALHLVHPPLPWWPGLLKTCLPGVSVEVEEQPQPRDPRARRLAARLVRALVTERRLKRLAPSARSRVLAVVQARYWDGQRDTLMQPVLDALEARGFDVRVLVQSHSGYSRGLHGLRTRPKPHLFGDVVYLRSLRHRAEPLPALHFPETPLSIEGTDWAPAIRPWFESAFPVIFGEQARLLQVLPGLLEQLNPSVVLLLDENGAEHFVTMACTQQGVPMVAVQHGCIHAHHLHYMFPPDATPAQVPLATRTCVYGAHYQQLLAAQSIYPASGVVVTGDPQRSGAAFASPVRSAEAEAFRREIMPPGAEVLILLTSQDLVHAIMAPPFLRALAASSPRVFALIRPHPREEGTAHWEQWIRHHGVEGRVVLRRSPSLACMLDACDIHCSASSTALGEAVIHGRPNLVVGRALLGDWMGVLEEDLAQPLEGFSSLEAAASHVLRTEGDHGRAYAAARSRYIERHYGPAGQAPEAAIADVVEAVLGGEAPERRGF